MIRRGLLPAIAACLLISCLRECLAAPNADIFPAQPAAKNAADWKDGYFWINGKPTFLTSGEMHYARIPRELWRDRIWRAKEMGLNCIQMYVFWNATEAKEGQWDFTDNLDLDAWLTMIQDAGLYAVVRVGPYSCAEWDQGGFPAWLTAKPGMTLRDSGVDYDRYAYRHLDQVEKIVAKHQLNHGGNVIMVQLENEHPRGWGTDEKDPYLAHLVDQARANGLEVPLFLSGLHHGNDPAGDTPFTVGSSPWYTTEFWTGWIGKYGDMDPGMLQQKIAGTWKIIAFGGAGYDYYVVHGGTNFGYSGFSHDATYDYAAPIGESGRFNNFYTPAKRAAYFAQSFSSLLTGSHNDPSLAKADAPDVRVTSRTNPMLGSMIMLDRFQKKSAGGAIAPTASAYQAPSADLSAARATRLTIGGLTLPNQGELSIDTLEPKTVLINIPWTPNATFESICTNVLLRQTIGAVDYWVCYGSPGAAGEITLKRDNHAPSTIDFTYPDDASVKEIDLDSGDQHKAKFLVMNRALTAKTWLANGKILIGPSFVQEDGSFEFPVEGGTATIYSASGKSKLSQPPVQAPGIPTLAGWSWRDGAPERSGDLRKDDWQQTTGPQPIGAVGSYQNRYAWYRTTLHADAASSISLHFTGGPGPCVAFLNGELSSLDKLDFKSGENVLAVLIKAEPRSTLYNQIGVVGVTLERGLWGGVSTDPAATPLDVSWKTWISAASAGKAEDVSISQYDDSSWEHVTSDNLSNIASNRRWLRGTFTLAADQLDSFIQAPDFEKWKSSLYINGRPFSSFENDLSNILIAGKNVVLLEPHDKKASLTNLSLELWHNAPVAHSAWYFHGGLAGLKETAIIGRVTNWDKFLSAQPWKKMETAIPAQPAFWRSTFVYQPDPKIHETLGLQTDGLRAGNVWLNGHNLGECPQKVPVYMPECWLKSGENDLVIFDLYGSNPDKVRISRYEAFVVAPPPKS